MSNLKTFQYQGSPINFSEINGIIMADATLMAKPFNKKPDDIFKTKTWKEYEAAVIEEKGLSFENIRSIENGNNSWIHQELVIEFARRLNPKFSIWCNDRIAELLRDGSTQIKPTSQAHIALQLAQALVDHEERLLSVESKLSQLSRIQEEGSANLLLLERSEEKMPEESLRAKIRKLVSAYCNAKLTTYQDAWAIVYDRLYYRYNIAIKKYKKKNGETNLDVAERNGFLDKIFVIASNELTI